MCEFSDAWDASSTPPASIQRDSIDVTVCALPSKAGTAALEPAAAKAR